MNEDQSQQQNPTSPPQPGYTSPPQPPLVPQMPPRNQLPENLSTIKQVEKITVWVMVISAILFAGVSVLAIWGVFSDASGDIVGKSLGTLAVIAFAALIVNIGANMLEGKKNRSRLCGGHSTRSKWRCLFFTWSAWSNHNNSNRRRDFTLGWLW